MDRKESAGEEIGRRRNEDFEVDVTKMDGIRSVRITGTTKVWKISKKVQER